MAVSSPRSSLRGSANFWTGLGLLLLILGVLLIASSSPLSPGMSGAGSFLFAIGSLCCTMAFFMRLFARIEERIMGLEGRLPEPAAPPISPAAAPVADTGTWKFASDT